MQHQRHDVLQHAIDMDTNDMESCAIQETDSLDLLIVDDHKLVLSGMRRLLEDNPLINTITEASSGEEAVALAAGRQFGAVVMDLVLQTLLRVIYSTDSQSICLCMVL